MRWVALLLLVVAGCGKSKTDLIAEYEYEQKELDKLTKSAADQIEALRNDLKTNLDFYGDSDEHQAEKKKAIEFMGQLANKQLH